MSAENSDPTNGLQKLLAHLAEVARDPVATVSLALLLSLVALIALILRV